MRRLWVCGILLMLPLVAAQEGPSPTVPPYFVPDLVANASNQRVDLTWLAPVEQANEFRVYVFSDGAPFTNRTINGTAATFFLTNGQMYVFQVAAIKPDGTEGPLSYPVSATPRLQNDLAYLAAGLIAIWVGLFGYAAFLARKEASIDAKLERILQTRFQGRSP